MTRREFLYYIWGASIALLTAQSAGLLVWFLIPRFREGEFGGKFVVSVDNVPAVNSEPINVPDGRFWLVNLDTDQPNALMEKVSDEGPIKGVAAIYKVCTHLGCIYSWTPTNNRFECPCHGSKYRLDGRRIEDPAPRTLDRFEIEALDADKNPITNNGISPAIEVNGTDFYAPLELPEGTAYLSVNTGARKVGPKQELLPNVPK
ncbi:MAG: Rieske 2Fe-2S domain-containing protein [Anaerolineales bacterium]|nr:Rieske 2Fe-2S domain-containing protein [Anaerolineales bacterium]